MLLSRRIIVLAAVVMLGGCTMLHDNQSLNTLNHAQAVGSPFTKHLAAGYRILANRLHDQSFRSSDVDHFAKKGLAAVDGVIVMPEVLGDWNLNESSMVELAQARAALLSTFDNGGRQIEPDEAADAQLNFDCWIQQQEGVSQPVNTDCKRQFMVSLKSLQDAVDARMKPPLPAALTKAPIEHAAEAETAVETEKATKPVSHHRMRSFTVFFSPNKSALSVDSRNVIAAVAKSYKGHKKSVKRVVIVGHADKHHKKLALRRASAVRAALVKKGIPSKKISVQTRLTNVKGEAGRSADILFK